jgi:hypothetical protein
MKGQSQEEKAYHEYEERAEDSDEYDPCLPGKRCRCGGKNVELKQLLLFSY